jgi:diguanylate cyclase (GGDEF)-like protein
MGSEDRLSDVLSEFARTMVTDFPIQSILDQLVDRIVDVLPITSAGVTLIAPGRDPHFIAASDEDALQYEKLQTELGEGPCTDAYATNAPVSVPDLATDDRFSIFGPRALELGLGAVFTFPLHHGEKCLGALDLYRETPGAMDSDAMAAAQTLADVVTAYLLNAQTRDELRNSSENFRNSALHDALTGLPNRVLLRQRLEHAVLRAHRLHKVIAILFLDLDRFKEVNDMYGHQAGDDLLIAVAQRLNGLLRPGDTVARMAGDEFVVLCEDLDDEAQAGVLANRVVDALAEPFVLSTTTVNVSASVGIAFAGPGDNVPDQLLQDADEAMYQAKRAGGDRHQLIDLRERLQSETRASLEKDLRSAAERDELYLDYQPIARTQDGQIIGIEALLRWNHPQRGLIAPMTLISIAEQSDLILSVGAWVLEHACEDFRRLDTVVGPGTLELFVNVSPHQLMGHGFCNSVEKILTMAGDELRRLTLEITENVYVEDGERAIMVLEDLKGVGANIALDDFGTGYSSLSYLQRFPIDIIKIDKGFTAKLGSDPTSGVIVAAVIDVAHTLGKKVIAEGVETADQHDRLTALGCDSFQGFYLARPMSAENLEEQLVAGGGLITNKA